MIARAAALFALALVAVAWPAAAQRPKAPAPKRCILELERAIEREFARTEQGAGNENIYLGGNVRFKCQGQNVRVGADSVESINGDVVRFITRAYYRDAGADVSLRAYSSPTTSRASGSRRAGRCTCSRPAIPRPSMAPTSTISGRSREFATAPRPWRCSGRR